MGGTDKLKPGRCVLQMAPGQDGADRYEIRVTLRVRGELEEKDLERLKRAARRCPVREVLSQSATVEEEIQLL